MQLPNLIDQFNEQQKQQTPQSGNVINDAIAQEASPAAPFSGDPADVSSSPFRQSLTNNAINAAQAQQVGLSVPGSESPEGSIAGRLLSGEALSDPNKPWYKRLWDMADMPLIDFNSLDPENTALASLGESLAGETGRKLGAGLESGAKSFATGLTKPWQLALMVGTLGSGSLWETGATAALKAGGLEAGEIATMEKGASIVANAATKGVDPLKALTASGVDMGVWQKGVQALAREGIAPAHAEGAAQALLSKQGIITGLGSSVLRSMGVGIGQAGTVTKTIQSLVDLGFSGQMLMGLAQEAPAFLDSLKEGDTERAANLAVQIGAGSFFTWGGLRALGRDAKEGYDAASEKLGLKIRPQYAWQKLRDSFLGEYQQDVATAHHDAQTFRSDNLDKFKKLSPVQLQGVKNLVEAGFDPAQQTNNEWAQRLAYRHDLLAENAGRTDRIGDGTVPDLDKDKDERYRELAGEQRLKNGRNYEDKELDDLLESYKQAAKPTQQMQDLAGIVQRAFAKVGTEAHAGNVVSQIIDYYTTNMWGKDLDRPEDPNEAVNELRHQAGQGEFHTNVSMARQRTFANAFEGQMLGRKLSVTNPIELVGNQIARVGEAIATRGALERLRNLRASTGQPLAVLAGTGKVRDGADGESPDIAVNPRAVRSIPIRQQDEAWLKRNNQWELFKRLGKIVAVGRGEEEPGTLFQTAEAPAATSTGNQEIRDLANAYNRAVGRAPFPDNEVAPNVDPRAKEIARAYQEMVHNPDDPAVQAAYAQLKDEVRGQWDWATQHGITFEPWDKPGQPYANSSEMTDDVRNNHHLYFFRGGDLPQNHPLAAVDPETGFSYNEMFRAIHDLFGHAKEGYQFGPKGEEGAFQSHSRMFSPLAQQAMFSETKAQNSWVNFGPHMLNEAGEPFKKGEPGYVAPANRPFAENKAVVVPEHLRQPLMSPTQILDHLTDPDSKWAILQADNPNNELLSPEENAARTRQLAQEIKSLGYAAYPIEGHTVDVGATPEQGFIVPGMPPELAEQLGRKYEQAGIVNNTGLVDLVSGARTPLTGQLETGNAAKDHNYYTVINTPQGPLPFHLGLGDESMRTEGEPAFFQRGPRRPADVTPEEWEALTPATRAGVYEILATLPGEQEFEHASLAGATAKDWYTTYAPAFRELVGEADLEPFTRLLAALSPRKPVVEDMIQTMHFWADWLERGRPTDKQSLTEIGRANGVIGATHAKGETGYKLPPNVITALTSQEPLSGPKVSAFSANLLGDTTRATLDTWMRIFGGMPMRVDKAGKMTAKGFTPEEYIAYQSRVRKVANKMGWTPDQVQAATWTFVKTLAEMGGLGEKTSIPLERVAKLIRPEDLRVRSQEFINLIVDAFEGQDEPTQQGLPGMEEDVRASQRQEIRNALNRLGIDSSRIEAAKSAAERVRNAGAKEGGTESPSDRIITAIARRLEANRTNIAAQLRIKSNLGLFDNQSEELNQTGGRVQAPQALKDIQAMEKAGFSVVDMNPNQPPPNTGSPYNSLSWLHPGLQKYVVLDPTKNQMHETAAKAAHPEIKVTSDAFQQMFKDGWVRIREQRNGRYNLMYDVNELTPPVERAIENDLLGRIDRGVYDHSGVVVQENLGKTDDNAGVIGAGTKYTAFTVGDLAANNLDLDKTIRRMGANQSLMARAAQAASALTPREQIAANDALTREAEPDEMTPEEQAAVAKFYDRQKLGPVAQGFHRDLQDKMHATPVQADGALIFATALAQAEHMTLDDFIQKRIERVGRAGEEPSSKEFFQLAGRGGWLLPGGGVGWLRSGELHEGAASRLKLGNDADAALGKGAVRFGVLGDRVHFEVDRLTPTIREQIRSAITDPKLGLLEALGNEGTVSIEQKSPHAFDAMDTTDALQMLRSGKSLAPVFAQGKEKGDVKGATTFMRNGKAVISATEKGDFSTIIHEFAHAFKDDILSDQADRDAVEQHLGVKKGVWNRNNHEQFAREVESYFKDGKAPIPELQGIFARIANWMRNIYTKLRGLPTVSDEVRNALDNKFQALTAEPESTSAQAGRRPEAGQTLHQEAEPAEEPKYMWNPDEYMDVDHPAFRGWNWAVNTPNGVPVMVEGRLKIHPEAYNFVNRAVGAEKSGVKSLPITKGLLGAGSLAKHTLLSLSPFHIPQIGLRAIMSGVLPRVVRWDLHNDPELARGVRNGLTVSSRYGIKDYQEGLVGTGGLVAKVPKVRNVQNWLQEFTFEKLLPSLKVLTYRKLYQRNIEMFKDEGFRQKYIAQHPDFGGLNLNDTAARAAALETNERLGNLNYRDMGRAAGAQDFLRLTTLAPDWLESEIRMVKRMFDPTGGKLLRRDMLFMTAGMWATARVLNLLFTGKPHNEAPFGVASTDDQGREKVYSIRTLPTDFLHMASDPVGFLKGRMSPFVRSATTALTGRDEQGRKMTGWQTAIDLTRNLTPIPVQAIGKAANGELPSDIGNSGQAVKALGGTVTMYKTEAQKEAATLASQKSETGPVDAAALRRHQAQMQLEDQLRSGEVTPQDLYQAVEAGSLPQEQAKSMLKEISETKGMDTDMARLYMRASKLPMADFLKVWDLSGNDEKVALTRLLLKKKTTYFKNALKTMTPQQRQSDPTYQRLRALFPQQAPW